MSEEPKLRPFAAMEVVARHAILMVGLGFVGMVAGALLTSALISRLNDRMDVAEESILQGAIGLLLPNLWAVVVMPGLGWITLRFLDLRPASFAVVTCGTGFLFHSALAIVTGGVESLTADPVGLGAQVAFFLAGVVLTYLGALGGQRHAKAEAALAAEKAKQAKAQYDQFAEQAKALAERREAQPIAAPGPEAVDPTASSGPSPGALAAGTGSGPVPSAAEPQSPSAAAAEPADPRRP